MSRHRNVKHLIDEDYDDYEDDYYDDYDDYDDGYTAAGSSSINKSKKKAAPKKQSPQTAAPKTPVAQQQPKGGAAAVSNKRSNSKSPLRRAGPPGFSSPSTTSVKSPAVKSPAPLPVSSPLKSPLVSSSKVSTSSSPQPPPPIPAVLLADTTTTKKKAALTVVVLGHVDAGKSTVTGNLLYGRNSSSSNTSKTRSNKAATVNYAWMLDEDEQERAHGVTMDIGVKTLLDGGGDDKNSFLKHNIVLQDAPGHADYVPAMITGTAVADAALLTVDATDLQTALRGQLREHVWIARGLGVMQILVACNKMDLVGWDNAAAYAAMETQLRAFLTHTVGYPEHRVRCVPVSGLTGTNLFPTTNTNDSNDMDEDTRKLRSWYNGPTLLQALDEFEAPVQQQQKLLEKPLRIILSDVGGDTGAGSNGVSVRAKVVQGWVKVGEPLVILPSGDETTVSKLVSLHSSSSGDPQPLSSSSSSQQQRSGTASSSSSSRQQYCVAGELMDCVVTQVDAQRVSTGSILARPGNVPVLASRCRAKIFVLGDNLTVPLIRGAQVILHMHHLDIPCHLAALLRTLDGNGATVRERPRALTSKSGNAVVELQLAVPICMEAFSECRALGKFVLRRSGDSIAVGRIEQVIK